MICWCTDGVVNVTSEIEKNQLWRVLQKNMREESDGEDEIDEVILS